MIIKHWYRKNYPNDKQGKFIDSKITFENVFELLINNAFSAFDGDKTTCIYEYIGVTDSLIRERIFQKLAEIKRKDYDFIYKLWLKQPIDL